jgi:hypothetical protein
MVNHFYCKIHFYKKKETSLNEFLIGCDVQLT